MIANLVRKNRSVRRFDEAHRVTRETLRGLVDLARLCASAANRQPLKYALCCTPEKNAAVFGCLAWAAYLTDWPGPDEGERPAAYIVVLHDTSIARSPGCDHGIAAQTILLGAVEQGLAGCLIGAFQAGRLREALSLPDRLEPLLVIALGAPQEAVVVEPLPADGDVRYWRDADGVHHVPKRSLDDVIV